MSDEELLEESPSNKPKKDTRSLKLEYSPTQKTKKNKESPAKVQEGTDGEMEEEEDGQKEKEKGKKGKKKEKKGKKGKKEKRKKGKGKKKGSAEEGEEETEEGEAKEKKAKKKGKKRKREDDEEGEQDPDAKKAKASDDEPSDNIAISPSARVCKENTIAALALLNKHEKKINLESEDSDIFATLNALFEDSTANDIKLASVFFKCLGLLIENQFPIEKSQQIALFMLREFVVVPKELFGYGVKMILDSVPTAKHDGTVFVFLPKFLIALMSEPDVYVDDKEDVGSRFVNNSLTQLFQMKWPSSIICKLIEHLREFNMDNNLFDTFLAKIFKELAELEIDEFPSVIYQVLLMTKKGKEIPILKGIVNTLNALEEKYAEGKELSSLRAMEATVFVHIDLAVRRDQVLGLAFLKILKSENSEFTPFNIGLLLLLSKCIVSERDKIMEYLLNSYLKRRNTLPVWFINSRREEDDPRSNLDGALSKVLESTEKSWGIILSNFVSLGSCFMDCPPKEHESHTVMKIGQSILVRCFKYHDAVRTNIIGLIFSRIATKSENSGLYIQLLSKIIAGSSVDTLFDLAKEIMKEGIDFLPFMVPSTTAELINALVTLIFMNNPLQNHLLLILRKSLFTKEIIARKNALMGFIQLLECLGKTEAKVGTRTEQLGFEILGFLHRCVSQQCEIREELYSGLARVSVVNSELREPIIDFLVSQYRQYITLDRDPQIAFSLCIEGKPDTPSRDKGPEYVQMVEPLHCLVLALVRCVTQSKDDENQPKNLKSTTKLVEGLLQFLIDPKTELEQFELDKSSVYDETSMGIYNQNAATILIGLYEALMEYAALNDGEERGAQIEMLFNLCTKLRVTMNEAIKDKLPQAKKKKPKKKKKKKEDDSSDEEETEQNEEQPKAKGKPKAKFIPALRQTPRLNLTSIYQLLKYCSAADENPNYTTLKDKTLFVQWLIELTSNKIKEFAPPSRLNKPTEITFSIKSGALLFHLFLDNFVGDNSKKSEKSVPLLALEAYELSLSYVCQTNNIKKIAKFLTLTVNTVQDGKDIITQKEKDTTDDPATNIHRTIRKIEKLWKIVQGSGTAHNWNYCNILLRCVKNVQGYISLSKIPSHVKYLEDMFTINDQPLPSLNILISLYFSLSQRTGELKAFEKIAVILGQDTLPGDGKTKSQTKKIYVSLVQSVKEHIEEVQKVWEVMHQTLNLKVKQETENMSKEEGMRKLVYLRIRQIITILTELTSAKITEMNSSHLFKVLKLFYSVLGKQFKELTKLYKTYKLMPSSNFEELFPQIAKLTTKIYTLISTLQKNQTSETKIEVRREATAIPNLVESIENFEGKTLVFSTLIDVPLYSHFKRSIARDFKLTLQVSPSPAKSQAKKNKKTNK